MAQLRAELAARVEDAKIARREAARLEERDRERIAEHDLQCRRGGGREAVRAGFARLRQQEHDVGFAREGRGRLGGHRDEPDAEAPRIGEKIGELGGLSRPGKREHDVVALDHAEVAMARLGRMNEVSGRSRGREGRGDLAPDMAGFAHAGDDDAPFRRADERDRLPQRLAEIAGERGGQGLEPLALGRERAQRGGDGLARFGLKRRGAKRHRFPLFRNAARYNRRRWL